MKTIITSISRILPVAILAILLQSSMVYACDWCNNKFFMELNTTRKGTLLADELLRAIHAQHEFQTYAKRTNMEPEELTEIPTPREEQLAGLIRTARENVARTEAAAPVEAVPQPASAQVASASAPGSIASPIGRRSMSDRIAGRTPAPADHDFIDIIRRDNALETRPTSYVPKGTEPDVRLRITLDEGEVYIGNGVVYKGFVIDGTIPGPTLTVTEGDVVEFTIVNTGNIVHGASIHAAYTQTSKYIGNIAPRDSATVVFRANQPGVYMYHCAPGGHAIPMHIIYGQYGMMVVEPKERKFRLEEELGRGPDVEINILQHEYYHSGKYAVDGQGRPMYTAFNGKMFRYVEQPVMAKPGDYVRINFLNVGPNLLSTFHLVGIIWDYAYWQGHPDNIWVGGQSVTAGPSDSWTIEFRVPPDEGAYLMLSHAVGSTDRGAIGILMADRDADVKPVIDSQGPYHTPEEMAEIKEKATRKISPFKPGTEDVDVPVVFGPETDEVIVRIIGNSFYPKIIDIQPGTKVTFINEDVFTFMQGEFSGVHNAVGTSGPRSFATPLLAHAESASVVFEEVGEYTYICAPHPYMEGIIRVSEPRMVRFASGGGGGMSSGMGVIALVLALFAAFVSAIAIMGLKTKETTVSEKK